MIKALGEILKVKDVRMLAVALEGLENIFECGKEHFNDENGENRFVLLFEGYGFIDDLENLQGHQNHSIYAQTIKLIERFFSDETN